MNSAIVNRALGRKGTSKTVVHIECEKRTDTLKASDHRSAHFMHMSLGGGDGGRRAYMHNINNCFAQSIAISRAGFEVVLGLSLPNVVGVGCSTVQLDSVKIENKLSREFRGCFFALPLSLSPNPALINKYPSEDEQRRVDGFFIFGLESR